MYESSVDSRSRGTGCPYCSGNKVLKGFNDLATVNPSVAAQAHNWDPTAVSIGHNGVKDWRCNLGHIYQTTVTSRHGGHGCGICSNHIVVEGINDLKTTHPDLALELISHNPTEVSAGTRRRLQWRCESGHTWFTTGDARQRGSGCPRCSGNLVNVGVNDLATLNPDLASQAHGWDPTQVLTGSGQRKSWICTKGHTWIASVGSRHRGGYGCPGCARSGFDQTQDSYVYLIEHDQWDLIQIGITSHLRDRLKYHAKIGWEPIEVRGPMDGLLAQDLETSILKSLRKHKAKFANETDMIQFGGWTEAWTKASLNVTSIKQILDWVYEDEAK